MNVSNYNATALQQTEMQTGAQRDMVAMCEAGDNGHAVFVKLVFLFAVFSMICIPLVTTIAGRHVSASTRTEHAHVRP